MQRSDFNRAVGDSINSVHKMCTNDDYKNGKAPFYQFVTFIIGSETSL